MIDGWRRLLGSVAAVAFAVSACSASSVSPNSAAPAGAANAATIRPASTPWATVKPALAPTGPTETAKVVRIVDGDTIVVALGGKNVKVRYIGMDTPEDVDPNSPVEPMSREAAAANTTLVAGKTVVIERDVSETDQYGRLLRYVWLQQGASWTLVNLELVRLGFASALRYPPDVKYADLFESAQSGAESSLVGIWGLASTPAPTPKATPKATPKPTPGRPPADTEADEGGRPLPPVISAVPADRRRPRLPRRPRDGSGAGSGRSAPTTIASMATTTDWGVSRGAPRQSCSSPPPSTRCCSERTTEGGIDAGPVQRVLDRHDMAWELAMALLAVIYVAVGFALDDQAFQSMAPTLEALELGLTAIFAVEFVSRFSAAPSRSSYLRGHWIDLVAVIPVTRGLRILRVLRLLRLVRAFAGVYRALGHVGSLAEHRGLQTIILSWLGVMVICTTAIYFAERDVNESIRVAVRRAVVGRHNDDDRRLRRHRPEDGRRPDRGERPDAPRDRPLQRHHRDHHELPDRET